MDTASPGPTCGQLLRWSISVATTFSHSIFADMGRAIVSRPAVEKQKYATWKQRSLWQVGNWRRSRAKSSFTASRWERLWLCSCLLILMSSLLLLIVHMLIRTTFCVVLSTTD